ncbi:elongation factor 1-alpha [Aspergillus pseudocaelatus]|uniref:Elongation factor 1-alpha n=1 Tax=Aspergillus pseudocaelatus TaxID=1825620 RepID=A0ABQ6W5H4_9EURO|nr:elongation factor 1-alpha [Aspergillus pseudocaelatus]
MPKEKPQITVVVIGHLDHGKSTTAGHLMYKCGAVTRNTIREYEQEAAGMGKASFKYAWVLDKLQAERERGITMDISLCKFETPKYIVTVIDAPGHRDYIKNTITGASQADCAILVISADTGAFETGVEKGGQTREHLLHAFTLGVRQLIVAVNKMDTTRWSEERFNEIIKETSGFAKKVGYNPKATTFVPISGLYGDNMLEESEYMPWFKGWTKENRGGVVKGKTLLDAIDALEPMPNSTATDKPLRLPIREVQETETDTVLTGRIVTGTIYPGMVLTIAPTDTVVNVEYIEIDDEEVNQGTAGEHVSVHITITEGEGEIRPGYVAGDIDNDPPASVASFNAQVIVLDYPDEISAGYIFTVHCHSFHIPCRFSEIMDKMDRRTGRSIEHSPSSIRTGEAALVQLVPTKPMCVEPYSKNPCLGRFVVRDMDGTVGVGVIKSVEFGTVEEDDEDDEDDEDNEDDDDDDDDDDDEEYYSD